MKSWRVSIILYCASRFTCKLRLAFMDSKSSSSSSSSSRKWKYDVFLSFRGEDTCKSFTDHLYASLKQKGVFTFKDDKNLEKGKSISPELLKAIEESMFAVVILSENNAFSTWCLDELVKIMECKKKMGLIVLPIFYDVDPSKVRKLMHKRLLNTKNSWKRILKKSTCGELLWEKWPISLDGLYKTGNFCQWHYYYWIYSMTISSTYPNSLGCDSNAFDMTTTIPPLLVVYLSLRHVYLI